MFEISDIGEEKLQQGAKIKVIGVGGGGCNAVNTMIKAGLSGVEYLVANTDIQSLNASLAPTKIQLGVEITRGLGAGSNPEIGRKAALDEYEKLSEYLQDSDMVFITAGMGGGTGTGAAPVIAKLAKELGALTVGVVTKPFVFEGKKRFRVAETGIVVLEENVDSLITIPNQRLLYLAGESLSLVETFKKADDVLLNAVRGISDLINNIGHINADFADVSTVMANKGLSLMGTGICSGPDRAIKAATEAISSPLLEDISIDGATGIIINITGSESLTMHETNEAVTLIMEAADEDAEIIFGTVIDDSLEENIKVTVIATGLGGMERVPTSLNVDARKKVIEEKEEITNELSEKKISQDEKKNVNDDRNEEKILEQDDHQKKFSLAQSIRQASNKYDFNDDKIRVTKSDEVRSDINKNSTGNETKNNDLTVGEIEVPTTNETTRAQSIAEKLGFLSFNEDELDAPSFLRKEKLSSEINDNSTV